MFKQFDIEEWTDWIFVGIAGGVAIILIVAIASSVVHGVQTEAEWEFDLMRRDAEFGLRVVETWRHNRYDIGEVADEFWGVFWTDQPEDFRPWDRGQKISAMVEWLTEGRWTINHSWYRERL